MKVRRFEISTLGVDEASQGISTDPTLPAINQTSLGLRIPPVLPGVASGQQPRYLFLLATMKVVGFIKILGIRQGLTIGCNVTSSGQESPTNPLYAEEFLVTSPFWHFVDGNVSWHLVRETMDRKATTTPKTNAASWAYRESDRPAMLYNSFDNSSTDPQTGAPLQYNFGLTAYEPPNPNSWQPIAGLGNFKDIRFPWQAPTNASAIEEYVEGPCRISLYASVLQSNPATRPLPTLPEPSAIYPGGISPETAFVNSIGVTDNDAGVIPTAIYWRVFGSILFETVEDGV